jgi:hypothetical protein
MSRRRIVDGYQDPPSQQAWSWAIGPGSSPQASSTGFAEAVFGPACRTTARCPRSRRSRSSVARVSASVLPDRVDGGGRLPTAATS